MYQDYQIHRPPSVRYQAAGAGAATLPADHLLARRGGIRRIVKSPDEAGAPVIAHRILGGAVVPVLAAEGQDPNSDPAN
jgi:hypothetical protein